MKRIDISTRMYPKTFALVDDEDFTELSQTKWYVGRNHCGILYVVCDDKRMHRVILGLVKRDGLIVDHRNGNPLDNQRHNLRICTNQQNCMNSKPRKGSSIYKGVTYCKQSRNWQAQLIVNGKHVRLGSHQKEQDAAKAYDAKVTKLYGDFARTNF